SHGQTCDALDKRPPADLPVGAQRTKSERATQIVSFVDTTPRRPRLRWPALWCRTKGHARLGSLRTQYSQARSPARPRSISDARHDEWDDRRRVRMHDRADIRAPAIHRRVDRDLLIWAALRARHARAAQVEQLEIAGFHELGSAGLRDEEAVRCRRMPRADVAEGIQDALVREDVVRQDQIVHDLRRWESAHEPPRRSATRRR